MQKRGRTKKKEQTTNATTCVNSTQIISGTNVKNEMSEINEPMNIICLPESSQELTSEDCGILSKKLRTKQITNLLLFKA